MYINRTDLIVISRKWHKTNPLHKIKLVKNPVSGFLPRQFALTHVLQFPKHFNSSLKQRQHENSDSSVKFKWHTESLKSKHTCDIKNIMSQLLAASRL